MSGYGAVRCWFFHYVSVFFWLPLDAGTTVYSSVSVDILKPSDAVGAYARTMKRDNSG